ncbi:MAG: Terminase small subunit [Rhodospirillales bacterium]|nr:Terminase small subunit [Rhodospirillales bacterium]
MSLTPKQAKFVEAYLLDPNGTKAAIAAGYAPKSAAVEASRLLRHANVQAALSQGRKIVEFRSGITPEMVLAEFGKMGFASIADVMKWRSNVTTLGEDIETGEPILGVSNEVVLTDSQKLAPDQLASIAEISQTKDGALKVKMHDKIAALTRIGQHFGMFRPASSPDAPAPGKKEQAQRDAQERPAAGSDWGSDLDVVPTTRLN